MAGKALLFELIASDKASPAFLRVAGAADKAAASTERATKSMGAATARLGTVGASLTKHLTLPLLAVGAVSVAQAAKFQKSLNTIQIATDRTSAQMQASSKGLLAIAKSTGTGVSDLTDSFYVASKSGLTVAKSLAVTKAAAQGAKAENADLATVTQALTSVMASYGKTLTNPVAAMNEIIKGSALAKTTTQDFAASLSNVVPVASSLGISFDQVAGAIATMTQHGETAQRATDNLSNLITNLAGQNNVASQSLQQLGVNTVDLSKNLGKRGLTGSLDVVLDAIAKHGKDGLIVTSAFKQAATATASLQTEFKSMSPTLQANAKAFDAGKMSYKDFYAYTKSLGGQQFQMAKGFLNTEAQAKGFNNQLKSGNSTTKTLAATLQKALGGVTGMRVALMLSGQSASMFARSTEEVKKAATATKGDVLGWATTQDTLAVKMDKAKASLQVMAVEIGTALIPAISKIADKVSQAVHWFDGLSGSTKKFIGWSALVLVALGPVLSIFSRFGRLLTLGSRLATWRADMLGISSATQRSATSVAEAEAAQTRAVVTETDLQIAAIERMRLAAGAPIPMGAPVMRGGANAGVVAPGRGMGGMLVGTGLLIGGPMIGSKVGGKKGSRRNQAGTVAADAASGAGAGMIVGGPIGGAIGGGIGGVYGAYSSTRGIVVQGHGSIAPRGTSAPVVKPPTIFGHSFGGLPTPSSGVAVDQSIAALLKLDRAEQQAALASSVLGKSLLDLRGNNISTGAAAKQFGAALTDVAGRAKFSKAGLDGVSSASRVNRAYMTEALTAAEQHAAALQKSGKSAEYVRRALESDVGALEKTALHAGFSRREFEGMLKTMGLTPKQINTVMQTKTEKAKSEISDLQARINRIKQGKAPHLDANSAEARGVIASLQAQIDALRGKTLDIYVNTHNIALGGPKSSNRGVAVPHAAGGSVQDGYFTVGEEGGPRGWELGYKSGSKVQLWSNRDARKITGLDRLPGYAAGTGSKAPTGTQLSDVVSAFASLLAFAHSSTSAASDIRDAAASLRTAARAAGASTRELGRLATYSARLTALGASRDRVSARLGQRAGGTTAYDQLSAAQQNYSDSRSAVAGAVTGTFDISTAGQVYSDAPATAGSILSQLQKAAANATRFATLLKRLGREGLNKTLLNQLALAGPTAIDQATALAAATPKQLAQINTGYGQLNAAGAVAGTYVADQMYGAGVRSAQGLVNGLLSQQATLNRAIKRLGDGMVTQLKATLRIHSPSQVMHNLGAMTGEGYIRGVRSKIDGVQQASKHLAHAAVPATAGAGAAGGGDITFQVYGIEDPATFVRVAGTKIAHRQIMLSRI